jgi:DNA-directed RNA polymerase I, II, and III subunit RPABC1
MDQLDECTKLWRVRRTVLQMLIDRGYLVPRSEVDLSFVQFKEKYGEFPRRESLVMPFPRVADPTDVIIVFFADEQKVGVKTIKAYFDQMESEKIKRGVLILQSKLSSFAKNVLGDMAPNYILEEFLENELLVNITEHVLVPQHVVLSSDEKSQLLKRYKLKDSQLPRILITDPIARYYGLGRGQVVKIIRPSETAGRYVTYRVVV